MTEDPSRAAARRRRVEAFFEEVPEPEGSIEDLLDDARYRAAQQFDPTLQRASELRLRLAGPRVESGIYDPLVEERLSGPLGKELAAAGDPKMEQTRLGLFAISSGSVVLHYRPMTPLLADDGDQTAVEITPADAAVRRVLRLHSLFESQAPAAEIASAARENETLLRGARGVIETLQAFDLDLSATWWSPSGEMVRSTLTRTGRDHALEIFSQQERTQTEQVWGLVSALDVDGVVTVRRQSSKVPVQVGPDRVQEFTLGEQVHLVVINRALVDQVGLQRRRMDYELVERLPLAPELDL